MEKDIIKLNSDVKTIDSREAAEMMEIEHSKLLRMLEGDKTHIGIIPVLRKAQLGLSKYFVESTYKSGTREYKCYLCTKMGCEMLANKLTGEKGILFTAKYVDKFNEMENKLKEQENQFKLPQTYKEALLQLVEQVEANEQLQIQNESLTIENRLLQGEKFSWADINLINSLVRLYSSTVYGDFAKGWTEWKKNLLYKYGININSRITAYLNKTGKKTKPKTLSMLKGDEEISNGIITILTMCKDEDVNVDNIIKHQQEVENKN